MKKIIRRRTKLLLLIMAIALLSTGCTIKQNQLVIVENHENGNISIGSNIDIGKIDRSKITNDLQKSETLTQNSDVDFIPLLFNGTYTSLISMEITKNAASNELNQRTISGNYYQYVNLFVTHIEDGQKTLIGQFLNPKDYVFDETGTNLAFIDGGNNVYIYNIPGNQLKNIVAGKKSFVHPGVSWSKDTNRLIVDNRSVYDVASGQLISVAVDSYTPFIRKKFDDNLYLVTMRNSDYQDILSLYDYKSKSFKSLATGVYFDSDYLSLLYSKNDNTGLTLLNLKTMESQLIEREQVYSAAILKQSGAVIYTVLNEDQINYKRYQLIVYSPETKQKTRYDIESPSFYLSPACDKITFIPEFAGSKLVKETKAFTNTAYVYENDSEDLNGIKNVVAEMFLLDYHFIGEFEAYKKQAELIYDNSFDPLPQEALDNKLQDFIKYQGPIPPNQKRFGMPAEITYSTVVINGNRATIKVDNYWTNHIELEKISNRWKIIGLSTFPDSIALAKIRYSVSSHLADMKKKDKPQSIKYWSNEKFSSFSDRQVKIMESILKDIEKYTITIGEVEFWNSMESHRADDTMTADTAKVKIRFRSVDTEKKYLLLLKKNEVGNYEIEEWISDEN